MKKLFYILRSNRLWSHGYLAKPFMVCKYLNIKETCLDCISDEYDNDFLYKHSYDNFYRVFKSSVFNN